MKLIMHFFIFISVTLLYVTSVQAEQYELFSEPVSHNVYMADSYYNLANSKEKLYAIGVYNTDLGKSVSKNSDINLNLFGKNLSYKVNNVTRKQGNRVSYSATNTDNNTLSIAERNGRVVGSIQHEGKLYKLRTADNGDSLIIEVPNEILIDHDENYQENDNILDFNINGDVNQDSLADSSSEFTVIVAYTSDFVTALGGIDSVPAYMDLLELESNTSYANSSVNTSVKIVHTYQTAYTDSQNFFTDRDYFADSANAEVSELHTLRDQYRADVMIILTGAGYSYCGIAGEIGATEANAYALASESCATGYYSFAHEIGHLFGARHIMTQDSTLTPYAYGHGYCNVTPDTWRTVMAYNCPADVGGPRVQQWSNPDLNYLGQVTGTETREDNARVMNVRAWTVANFRSDDSYEENDTLATAYDLSLDEQDWLSTIAGMGVQSDRDWYKIYVTPNYNRVLVDLRFTDADGNINMALYNSSGSTLASSLSTTDNEYIDYEVPAGGGDFYLQIDHDNAGNSYDLWWDDIKPASDDPYEQNDTLATAYDLSYKELQWLRNIEGLGIQSDKDWYKIKVTPLYNHLLVDLRFTHADGDINMALYNSSGSTLASSLSTTDNEYIDFEVPAAGGDFYLQIDNDDAGNSYDLWWDDIKPVVNNDDAYEVNNAMEMAYNLSKNEDTWLSKINGMGIQFDRDWYKIYVSTGYNRVLVDLQFLHADGDINMALYDSTGSKLASSLSATNNEYIDYTVPVGGSYYLQIDHGNAGNNYNLWWDDVKPPKVIIAPLMLLLF